MRTFLKRVAVQFHPSRLFYMALFALIFTIIGVVGPYSYLRFFDKTEYIKYLVPVSFDKKIYAPCEEQQALVKIQALIDSHVNVQSRLYLIIVNSKTELEVIKEYSMESFIASNKSPIIVVSKVQLPCNLQEGTYFYRGILTYKIKGIEKSSQFTSDQFTITQAKDDDLR